LLNKPKPGELAPDIHSEIKIPRAQTTPAFHFCYAEIRFIQQFS